MRWHELMEDVEIDYPSDFEPLLVEKTIRFRHLTLLVGGLMRVFAGRDDVFVAGELLWYPNYGQMHYPLAPDVMVVFGRPPVHRLSYKQWEEEDISPQVVFKFKSPTDTPQELHHKFRLYESHYVLEYYVFDPVAIRLDGWVYQEGKIGLVKVPDIEKGFTSPRLGIHLKVDGDLQIIGPDGVKFLDYEQLVAEKEIAEKEKAIADAKLFALMQKLRAQGIDPETLTPPA
jgi:Uma2 family endonuclease